jgi:hypothetical protein
VLHYSKEGNIKKWWTGRKEANNEVRKEKKEKKRRKRLNVTHPITP